MLRRRSNSDSVAKDNPDMYDMKHGIKMGVPKDGCDDAKVSLKWKKSHIF